MNYSIHSLLLTGGEQPAAGKKSLRLHTFTTTKKIAAEPQRKTSATSQYFPIEEVPEARRCRPMLVAVTLLIVSWSTSPKSSGIHLRHIVLGCIKTKFSSRRFIFQHLSSSTSSSDITKSLKLFALFLPTFFWTFRDRSSIFHNVYELVA